MIPILDWIFEGIVGWVSSIASQLLDAVSGLFLEALGTDMTAMEEYFPFVTKAYGVMQVTAYAILILIVLWQLFRAFGGPITEAENPWHLVVRGALFGFLIGYAKPIFAACLTIARAPYTSLMDLTMTGEDFTFAGVEQALTNGLTTLVATASVVGLILILILLIALGWNYFKLLLRQWNDILLLAYFAILRRWHSPWELPKAPVTYLSPGAVWSALSYCSLL